jgi:hypothetical protein
MSDESTALVLYPTMRPADHPLNRQEQATPPPEPPPTQSQQQAAPDRPIEQVMYGDTMYAEAETTLLPDAMLDGSPEQISAARADYRAELHKVELPAPLARDLTAQFVAAMKAPISDEEHAAQRTKMHTELAQRFGRDGAKECLADVRALLAKSKYLADALVDAGLDVRTDVIVALAEHARSLRGRGRP